MELSPACRVRSLEGPVKEGAFEADSPERRRKNQRVLAFPLPTVKIPEAAIGGQVGSNAEGGRASGREGVSRGEQGRAVWESELAAFHRECVKVVGFSKTLGGMGPEKSRLRRGWMCALSHV